MSKLFSVVGVSRLRAQDPFKLRVANGGADGRAKRLMRGGHVDVNLFDTEPMTKEQALDWLELTYPNYAAQIAGKQVKAMRAKSAKVKPAKSKVAKSKVEVQPVVEVKVEVKDEALSPAAKLALKRVRDAARKREKRAAEKAAKAAVAA